MPSLFGIACLVLLSTAISACALGPSILNEEDRTAESLLRPDEWIEVRDGALTIYSNAPEDDVLGMVEDLSLLRGVLRRVTNFERVDDPPPGRVVLLRGPLSYRYFQPSPGTAAYFAQLSRGQTIVSNAGLEERIRIPGTTRYATAYSSSWQPAARRLLYHEYVHLMLRNSRALTYPPWYDEGIAEMLSTVRTREGNVEVGIVARRREPVPMSMLQVLETRNYWTLPEEQRETFYARSWGLVHMLAAGHVVGLPDRRAAIQRYLVLLNEGRSVEDASLEAFDVGPPALGSQLDEYLRSDRIPYLKIPVGEFEVRRRPPPTRKLSRSEALLMMAEVSSHVFGVDAARTDRMLRAAEAADPEDPRVAAWRALSLGVGGRAAESAVQLARADIASDGDPEVDRVLARLLLHQAEAAETPESREALVQMAQRRLRGALAAEPDSFEGLMLLGFGHVLSATDPAPGIDALERAREQVPSSTTAHLYLAELYRRSAMWLRARERVEVVLQWSGVEEELAMAGEISRAIAQRRSGTDPLGEGSS